MRNRPVLSRILYMRSGTVYHKILRVGAVAVAGLLFFQSNGIPFVNLPSVLNARVLVANVIGISAGVAPTELNTITAELTKRTTELDKREALVKEREINARATDSSASFVVSNYILSAVLLLLLVLIITNYAFDFLRARKIQNYASAS